MTEEYNPSEIRTGLVRQRRSLIVSSLGLLLLQTAGLKIEKVSILGNEFLVQQTQFLSVAIWVAYAYFLVRYYQYYHDLGDTGVRTIYNTRINYLISEWAFRKIKKEYLDSRKDTKGTKYEFKQYESKRIWHDRLAAMIDMKVPVDIINVKNSNISVTGSTIEKTETAIWRVGLRVRIQAFIHICLRTRLITEYFFPFIIASTPVFWWLFVIIIA